jgi:hypothetical protein
VKFELDSAKNQFFYRSSFTRSFAFELTIERIRNVDGGSHNTMLPYLWLLVNDFRADCEQEKPEAYASGIKSPENCLLSRAGHHWRHRQRAVDLKREYGASHQRGRAMLAEPMHSG